MSTKLQINNQNKDVDENDIYLSSPVSLKGKIRYELPQRLINTGNHKTGNGYEPASTLNNQAVTTQIEEYCI